METKNKQARPLVDPHATALKQDEQLRRQQAWDKKHAQIQKELKVKKDICLNDQTAGNLVKYLQRFPLDAKVMVWHDYKEYDCRICCNFEHQEKINIVQLMLGSFVKDS